MTKIPTSENKLIELSFEGECLQALQRFAHADNTGSKSQVGQDLKRIHGLTVKDDELGEWSYTQINLDKNT
ncbi:hypothetical protein [Rickettsiella endosymbiont of Rhagonycha lignosa]|uniref:hypothetical protein n=1 Tax=Rickettsiella endosymbiont of Rhagonycha lignosa TaxID=3077937 RepID=UPI00313DC311